MKNGRATGFPTEMSRMRIVFFWSALVMAVVTLGKVEGKIECYVCDWNPSSDKNSSSNLVDTCSSYNFQADKAGKVLCEGGCEATSYKDSNNNHTVLHFYRNCVGSSSGNILEDNCRTIPDKLNHYYSTCECTSNLCNSSVTTLPFTSLLFYLLFISFILALTPYTFYR